MAFYEESTFSPDRFGLVNNPGVAVLHAEDGRTVETIGQPGALDRHRLVYMGGSATQQAVEVVSRDPSADLWPGTSRWHPARHQML